MRVHGCGGVGAWHSTVDGLRAGGSHQGHGGAGGDSLEVRGRWKDGFLGLGDGDRAGRGAGVPVGAWAGGGGEVRALATSGGRGGRGWAIKEVLEAVPARGGGG